MAIQFIALHPAVTADHLGIIPLFFDPLNEEPAAKQLDAMYQHGGGWRPMAGWTYNEKNGAIQYGDPNDEDADPPYYPIAFAMLREEMILVYDHAWVNIVQPDGSFEIARVD